MQITPCLFIISSLPHSKALSEESRDVSQTLNFISRIYEIKNSIVVENSGS
jgi:hypothetical protein